MEEKLPAIKAVADLISPSRFQYMQEVANYLSRSDLIPAHFKGKPANVFIAMELALRQDMSVFMVMQNLYVVYGRPGFEAKLVIALVNQSGQYDHELEYDIIKENGKIVSCTAWTERQGHRIEGPPVTAEMVKNEKWDAPKQSMLSKWVTMPEMMYRYRAATYFARVNCPQVLMGLQTREEIEDVTEYPSASLPLEAIVEEPSPEVILFNELFAAKNPTPDQEALLEQFLALYPGKTADEVKMEAVRNFDGHDRAFWPAFVKWCEKRTGGEKKERKTRSDKGTKRAYEMPSDESGISDQGQSLEGSATDATIAQEGKPERAITEETMAIIREQIPDLATLLHREGVSNLSELTEARGKQIVDLLAN